MLDKFAEELIDARLKSELSLQQIAGKTRIDLKFLENMEHGNFSFLPDLYIKAFIKEYARMVGLDEESTLTRYEAAKQGKLYEEKSIPDQKSEEIVEKEKEEIKPQTQPNKKLFSTEPHTSKDSSSGYSGSSSFKLDKQKRLVSVIAGGAIIISLIVYFAFIKSNSQIIINEKPYEQVQKENIQRYEKEKTSEKSKPVATIAKDSLSLLLTANDTSWIKIMMDGKNVQEFILFPKSRKELKAQSNFVMTVGNSGAISFLLDNKPLKFAGKDKKVEYLSIDSTGLKYLKSPPNFIQ